MHMQICSAKKTGIQEFQIFDSRKILLGNLVEACSVFRKRVWEECGGYDPDMGVMGYEDWDLWVSAMERGWNFYLIKEALFDYRVRLNSMLSGCNIPDNRRHLIEYICNKHKNTYIENLSYVISEKDIAPLNMEIAIKGLQETIKSIVNMWSWKITAPLRWFGRILIRCGIMKS